MRATWLEGLKVRVESDLNFEVLHYSDSRYEKLTAEVQYKGQPIAQINQDRGVGNLELEIFADVEDAVLKVPLSGFLQAIILAKEFIAE
ncbi:hypothetical protein [Pseudomonas sp. NPDC089406]|uniref:hypothetical protein n=1 Tax=Pseudomonas sp. NPDC089406 TaxID=3364463 RepID=UPI0038513FF1